MIQLRSVRKLDTTTSDGFPFSVPTIKTFSEYAFTSEITFLVGENGSGKSTFLEAIACAAGSIIVGSDDVDRDKTLNSMRTLAKALKLTWTNKRQAGFFLRAEDFFGFVKRLAQMREGFLKDLADVDEEYKGRSDMA